MAVSVNLGQRICEGGKWVFCHPVENELEYQINEKQENSIRLKE